MARDALLEEREKTHGSFEDNSRLYNRLIEAIPLDAYPPMLRYAITGIYIKLARMAAGHGMFPGHSEDVRGYANLIHEYVTKENTRGE